MIEARKTLSLRLDSKSPEEREADAATLIAEAIKHHQCVRWRYNKVLMRAAPHILYRRNGALHIDAFLTEKHGVAPTEMTVDYC